MIQQNPVLFSETLRANLDYSSKYTDAAIWDALLQVGLKEVVSTLPDQLDAKVDESDPNFSAGQIQLLLFARVILIKPKVLVLDESSAHVYADLQVLINHIILELFKESTVISVAHRLESIMGFDKIIVLENGEMVEFDSPSFLIEHKGMYYQFSSSKVGMK